MLGSSFTECSVTRRAPLPAAPSLRLSPPSFAPPFPSPRPRITQALELMLNQLGLLSPTATLPESFPAVEQEFKVLWADHGDAVSQQYAGGCMRGTRRQYREREGACGGVVGAQGAWWRRKPHVGGRGLGQGGESGLCRVRCSEDLKTPQEHYLSDRTGGASVAAKILHVTCTHQLPCRAIAG